jgi:hypothetical protein
MKSRSIAPHAHVRTLGKNRVEVRGDNHPRLLRKTGALSDNVALFISSNAFETDLLEASNDFESTYFFFERRRGDLTDADQIFIKLPVHLIYELKGPLDGGCV